MTCLGRIRTYPVDQPNHRETHSCWSACSVLLPHSIIFCCHVKDEPSWVIEQEAQHADQSRRVQEEGEAPSELI